MGLDQHCQNRFILPMKEHLLLLGSLFLHQPVALQCSTPPDHIILIFKIFILMKGQDCFYHHFRVWRLRQSKTGERATMISKNLMLTKNQSEPGFIKYLWIRAQPAFLRQCSSCSAVKNKICDSKGLQKYFSHSVILTWGRIMSCITFWVPFQTDYSFFYHFYF